MGVQFHFWNVTNEMYEVGVHHIGCGGTPWHGNLPKCWGKNVEANSHNVYPPSAWVTNFKRWLEYLITAGVTAAEICFIVATDGAGAAAIVEEVAGEAEELSAEEAAAVENAATDEAIDNVEVRAGIRSGKLKQIAKIIGATAVGIGAGEAADKIFSDEWKIWVSTKHGKNHQVRLACMCGGDYYIIIDGDWTSGLWIQDSDDGPI